MGVFYGFEELSDLEKEMHEITGMLAPWTMTNVCLWHLSVGVTLIYPTMRDL